MNSALDLINKICIVRCLQFFFICESDNIYQDIAVCISAMSSIFAEWSRYSAMSSIFAEWNRYNIYPERVGTFSNDKSHCVVMSNYAVIY